jgi:competence protein ComEC
MVLILLSCVWVLGIFVGYQFRLPWQFCLAGLAPLVLLIFTRKYLKLIIVTSLGIIIFVAAVAWTYTSLNTVDDSRVRFYNDLGVAEIKGELVSDTDIRDRTTHLILATESIKLDTEWRDVSGRVLVFVPRYPSYHYGDVLRVTGELRTPRPLGEFDYPGYLAHQGIYTTMLYPEIEVLATGQGFPPLAWIYSLREHLAQTLTQVLPEPQASLAQGIILGIRGNMPQEVRDDFSRSGTAHLLAISGLHLGVMAGIMLGIGLWLFGRRRYLYVWLAFGAVWLYAVITGMNPPVVRGAIMVSLFLVAEALGRQRSAMVALTFAAAVMAGVSPYILGDASFQMSFLAMAGLVFVFPVLRDYGRQLIAARIGEEGGLVSMAGLIVDTLSATLGAVIAVWPLIAYYFGIVSLVGPLATFLAVAALPLIILTGTLTAFVGLASISVAQVVGWLAWPFLTYLMLVVRGMAASSVSSVEVSSISPVFIIGYYVVLTAVLWFHSRWRRWRSLVSGAAGVMKEGVNLSFGLSRSVKWAIVPLLVLAVLVSYTAATMPDDNLHVSFVDVGQGDAIFIQKGSQQILVDGGPSPGSITLALGRRMPYWDRNIDFLVLTHPHQDHLAGLVEVLRRYSVSQVLYPALDYPSPLYDEFQETIKERGVKSITALAGQRIDLGDGMVMEVLHPPLVPLSRGEADIDNDSVVLRLKYGKVSFLLTGDIGRETEWELARERASLKSAVLKVGHHGSITSTTSDFLAVVNPAVAVISVGADNNFGLPDEDVLSRLEETVGTNNIYRTDKQGSIDFTTDGNKLWVVMER